MLGGGTNSATSFTAFSEAAAEFERQRQGTCTKEAQQKIKQALARVLAAKDSYVASSSADRDDWATTGGLRDQLQKAIDCEASVVELDAIVRLEGGKHGMLADLLGQMGS